MSKTRISRIQIFGERCTGTNYLESLVNVNLLDVKVTWDFGWKHFFHEPGVEQAGDTLFICIYRDPVDWLRSFDKKRWHVAPELKELSFSDYIRAEWQCVWDEDADKFPGDPLYRTEMLFERDPETGERFANVIKMRAAKIKNWESLQGKVAHQISIRYEDLESDPKAIIKLIASKFKIRRKFFFRKIDTYKGTGSTPYKKAAYKSIPAEDAEFILSQLDPALEAKAGYDLSAIRNRLFAPAGSSDYPGTGTR